MKYELPKLSYDYSALEPYLDARTMEIHHTKHHQTYVDKLNAALEKYPDLQNKPLEELLRSLNAIPQDIRTAIQNHGGGHYNHSLFWNVMAPKKGGEATGKIGELIKTFFGDFAKFQQVFTDAALSVFGSGWAWLVLDIDGKALKIVTTTNQDNPIMIGGQKPLLGLDVWEHAYYLRYQNRRAEYAQSWWHVVNWDEVNTLLG